MTRSHSPQQLDMSFQGDGRLAVRMREGQFFLLIEQNAPEREQPFDSAVALGAAIARRVDSEGLVAGLTVTDRFRREDCHDPVDTAAALMAAGSKPILLTVSGKGTDEARVKDILARGRSKGLRGIFAVTGDRSDRHEIKPGSRHIAPYEKGYLDAVDIIRICRRFADGFSIGAAVNPFKYNPADQYLQYYKMVRKLATGADFLIAHAGWDMRKCQELQWYLRMREIEHPVIARVLLLSMEDIGGVHEGLFPGVHVPRPFAAALQRESNISATQCMAAQLARIGLQVAGCRLLGYSGVQIAGIRDVRTLEMVLARVKESLERYDAYPEWVSAWNEYHEGMQFAPMANAYYGFDGLMDPGCRDYDPETCTPTDREFPEAAPGDKVRAEVFSGLLSTGSPDMVSDAARGLLAKMEEIPPERLRHCYYLNNRGCPKRLVYGPCGGSRPDGTCEFGHAPCFFHRVIAVAGHRHEPDLLEEGIPL